MKKSNKKELPVKETKAEEKLDVKQGLKETKAEEKLDVKQGLKEGSKTDLKKDAPKPFKKY